MNRRQAVAALMALPATSTITRAALKPRDVIVIECPGPISMETAERLRAYLKEVWPEHRCIVMGDGMKLRIAREDAV